MREAIETNVVIAMGVAAFLMLMALGLDMEQSNIKHGVYSQGRIFGTH